MAKILIVDDEEPNRAALERIFQRERWEVLCAADGRAALDLLREAEGQKEGRGEVAVLLTDLRMPGMDGMELLRRCRQVAPDVQIIVATAYGTVESAVEAMRAGAADYVAKPLRRAEVLACAERALDKHRLLTENRRLRELLDDPDQEVIGQAPALRRLLEEAAQAAPAVASILITGESGTGKGLLARWIHRRSGRAGARLVTVNCGAIPEALLESELFGHEAGAFTGAAARREGRFELAAGGTLFLDEITEMALPLQVKLLRVLQDGEFERVGGTRTLRSTARVLAGCNRDPLQAVRDGRLREDLYYRLHVIRLHVPPLRARPGDIPLLARSFVARHARRNRRPVQGIAPEALALLERHPWPGNVRELENAIERAVVLCRGDTVQIADLPAELRDPADGEVLHIPVGTPLRDVERRLIEATLRACDHDRARAAALLGINARTIYRRELEWRGAEDGNPRGSDGEG